MTRIQKTWMSVSMAAVVLLLIGGIGWALTNREDPQMQLVRELQTQAFSSDTDPDQRRDLFEKMRSESEKLTEEQRQSLREGVFANRQQEMQERMKTYFSLDKDARIAYLDDQISDMEQRRKEWEKRADQGTATGRGGGPGGDRVGGGRGRGNATAEEQNERRRGFLAMTSADDRAQFSAYIEDLNVRRETRGLEPMRRGGFGGGRGR